MICPKCNAPMDDNMRFCGICGEDMLRYQQTQQASAESEEKYEAAADNTENVQPPYDNSWQYNPAENQNYNANTFTPAENEDKPDTLMNVLSFFVPLVGMIMYFIEREKHPIKARAMLKWTVAAYIASYAFAAVMVVFAIGMMIFAMVMEGAFYW